VWKLDSGCQCFKLNEALSTNSSHLMIRLPRIAKSLLVKKKPVEHGWWLGPSFSQTSSHTNPIQLIWLVVQRGDIDMQSERLQVDAVMSLDPAITGV
jgi:hypothetical protein